MAYKACPTAVIEAPIDRVWTLLTNPAGWGDFFDLRITKVDPAGPAIVGQCVEAESGPRLLHLRIHFELKEIDASNFGINMIVNLPLGIRVHEELRCSSLGLDRCRVTYGCNFELPKGWRGLVVSLFLSREFENGPRDSLSRLKRAAELGLKLQ